MASPVQDGPPLPCDVAGTGPPVVMVHGLLNTRQIWAAVADRLSGRFCTIRCDLHRQANAVGPAPTTRLLRLMDWLNLPSVHIVTQGASWAAGAALAVQAPHRVSSLSLVDPVIPRAEQSQVFQEAWHVEMLLQWLSVGHGSQVRNPEHAQAIRAVVAQQTHVAMPAPEDPSGLPPLMGCGIPHLNAIQCPVVAMLGETVPAESKALVASTFGQIRRVRILPIPGANRHSPLEAPDFVAERLQAFLAEQK